jgi:hypothetical protein
MEEDMGKSLFLWTVTSWSMTDPGLRMDPR